jgi:hypothetical protein
MRVVMCVPVGMLLEVSVVMRVIVIVIVIVIVVVCVVIMMYVVMMGFAGLGVRRLMAMRRTEVDIELHAGDARFVGAPDMEVIAVEPQFGQFAFEQARVGTQVNEGGDKHIAGDAAGKVQVQRGHGLASALIWLAA